MHLGTMTRDQWVVIKHQADARAERAHGINAYAELAYRTGDVLTFCAVLMPDIVMGYMSYDATRDAWL